MRRRILQMAACLLLTMLASCSSFITSVERLPDGRYVMTGAQMHFWVGWKGFVWIGEYDPTSMTMAIKEIRR